MGSFVRALAARYRDLESRQRVQSTVSDHLRITQLIVDHLSRTAMWCGASTLGSSWSRVWNAIGGELRMDQEHVIELIRRTPHLALDVEADSITLSV
jgi:hypothetical protein